MTAEVVGVVNMTIEPYPFTIEDILELDHINIIMLTVGLGASMFIMGCDVCHANFTWQVRHPVGLWVGIVIVDLLMPLTGNVLSRILWLKPADAIALIVITSCPTDGLSSIFSYWTDSDVCLSLSITILSTALAVGTIPLGIIIYSRGWSELTLAIIPDIMILYIFVLVLVAVGLGMAIRRMSEKWAERFAKIASPIPLVVIISSIIFRLVYAPLSFQGSWKQWLAGALVPLFGFGYGYFLGFLAHQPPVGCRAIAFASANKSILLAAEVIYESFSPEVVAASFPLVGLSQITFVCEGLFFVMLYKIVICYLTW
ncbi:ileal sodium/bile acid cotransporter-like [Amphiura filiformis]|uniref:ileal sodium/bile acid cotransporter-like n=1 Tax=Amphiura filiformis TaxID=82378 RepID=UPI003B214633